jgi:hypothetical protein
MDASISHPSLAHPWGGTVAISDYTRRAATARDYGQARVKIPSDHSLITDTAITGIRGIFVTIDHALLGNASYIQIGKPAKTDRGWDLTCFEISYLLKLLRVPVQTQTLGNLPAGVIARKALEAALALANVPIVLGAFVEAAPLVESYQFTGQTLDELFQDLMTITGQEWEITPAGVVNWLPQVGTYYETVLTEGYDFCLLDFDEAEDSPVGAVVVTDQRGNSSVPAIAREHARDITARIVSIRADTTSTAATNLLAESLLNEGRIVRTVAKIGLYPQGGTLPITIPGPSSSGGEGFALMGGGFVLMGVQARLRWTGPRLPRRIGRSGPVTTFGSSRRPPASVATPACTGYAGSPLAIAIGTPFSISSRNRIGRWKHCRWRAGFRQPRQRRHGPLSGS